MSTTASSWETEPFYLTQLLQLVQAAQTVLHLDISHTREASSTLPQLRRLSSPGAGGHTGGGWDRDKTEQDIHSQRKMVLMLRQQHDSLWIQSSWRERKAGFLTGMVLLIALRVFSSFLYYLSLPLPILSTLIPLCCSNLLFQIYPGCSPIWRWLHKHFSNWGSGKGCSKLLGKSLVLMLTAEGPLCNTKLTITSINLNSSIVQW